MKIFLKQSMIFLVVSIFIMKCTVFAQAVQQTDNYYENAAFVLKSIGVITPDISYDEKISRGLATKLLAGVFFEEVPAAYENNIFSDVDSDNEYYNEINLISSMGIINGYDDNLFRPDDNMKFAEVTKILVTALGYGDISQQNGGYPNGYMTIAYKNNFFKGVDAISGDVITFGDFAKMLYNFMNARPLVITNYLLKNYSVDSENTMLDLKLERMRMEMLKATMTGNKYGSPSSDKLGYLELDGVLYIDKTVETNDYLGYYVTAFIKLADDGINEVVSVMPNYQKNNVFTLEYEDIEKASTDEIVYYDEDHKKTITFKNPPIISQNGKIAKSLSSNELHPVNGSLKMIDNNNDGEYEYVFLYTREYFKIERISYENNVIVLNREYCGSKSIYVDTYSTDYNHQILDANQNKLDIHDLSNEDYIYISGSNDGKLLTIGLLLNIITAQITELTNEEISLNGEMYRVAKQSDGQKAFDISQLRVGRQYKFFIDGSLVFDYEETKTDLKYGFIIDIGKSRGLNPKIECKLLTEDKKIVVTELADKITFNYVRKSKEDVDLGKNTLINYSFDSDGKISEIVSAKRYEEKETKRYIKDTKIFTSIRYNKPVLISPKTKIFVVPDSGEEDDYRAFMKLTNKATYEVEAFDFNQEDLSCGALVIYDDVYYDKPGFISQDSMPVIFSHKTRILDDESNEVYKIYWVEGNEEKSAVVKKTDVLNRTVHEMRCGDVFLYSVNSIELVDNIQVIAELSPEPEYYHSGEYSRKEYVYGLVQDARFNQLIPGSLGRVVSFLELKVSGGEVKNFIVSSSEPVYYYLYNTKAQKVRLATYNDILIGATRETNASRVFLYSVEGDTKVVVIVI